MRHLKKETQEKLPHVQIYIYTLGCLRKKIEDVYICP